MSQPFRMELDLPSEAATACLARAIAPHVGAADVLALSGPVGAGKSFFARHLIRTRLQEFGVDEDIPSPTYTLVQVYQAGSLEIWHCDLYRLTGSSDVLELGLDEAFDTALCLVEWPDRLGPDIPYTTLALDFSHGQSETHRKVIMTSPETRWAARLQNIQTVSDQSSPVAHA